MSSFGVLMSAFTLILSQNSGFWRVNFDRGMAAPEGLSDLAGVGLFFVYLSAPVPFILPTQGRRSVSLAAPAPRI